MREVMSCWYQITIGTVYSVTQANSDASSNSVDNRSCRSQVLWSIRALLSLSYTSVLSKFRISGIRLHLATLHSFICLNFDGFQLEGFQHM